MNQYLTLEYYGLDFVFLTGLMDILDQFSSVVLYVVIGFSLIAAFYMKKRIGVASSLMYLPAMAGSSFAAYYFFWQHDLLISNQDVERVFTAIIFGMVIALLVVMFANHVREHLQHRAIRAVGKERE